MKMITKKTSNFVADNSSCKGQRSDELFENYVKSISISSRIKTPTNVSRVHLKKDK